MRMIAAIAPLCAAMPIFGRALGAGRSTLNSKVSAAPTSKLHIPMQFGPSTATFAALRGGGQLFLLDAARIADLRITRGEHDRGADAAPPQRRDRIDHHGLRNDQHRDIDAVRQFVDARHARAAVELVARAADQMDRAIEAAALQIGEHGAARMAGLRRHADDRDRARPQQPIDPGGCFRVHASGEERGEAELLA